MRVIPLSWTRAAATAVQPPERNGCDETGVRAVADCGASAAARGRRGHGRGGWHTARPRLLLYNPTRSVRSV
jgi:hypothetical protein